MENNMKNKRNFKARLVIYGLGKETKSRDVVNWLKKEIEQIENDYSDYSSTMVTLKLMK